MTIETEQTELLREILAELRAIREVVAPEPRQSNADDYMVDPALYKHYLENDGPSAV